MKGRLHPIRVAFAAVSELMRHSAVVLAGLVRSGELSARELVSDSLTAIQERDPGINAFTHVAAESALSTADAISPGDPRPFAGVPIAIKDNRQVAGMPISNGSDLFGDAVAPSDAYCVRRLRDAGFVIVGKTALPELGILPTTESRRHGPTHNPWALDRTPGGSSGGAAAAVAAGMVPIAHGNDGGGSIRIPAACCGLVGLKPARGRVSVGPGAGHSFLATDGVLTRDVADTAAALDVLAGYEPGDVTWAPPPPARYVDVAAGALRGLRIGLVLNPPMDGASLDPLSERAARDAATLLAELGHDVSEATAPWSDLGLLAQFTQAFGPLISMGTLYGGRLAGRAVTEADVEPLTWALWEHSQSLNVLDYLAAQDGLEGLARSLVEWMDAFDVVLTPALGMRPVAIGEIHGRGPDPWRHYERSALFTPYTAIVNVTGQPAISLPLYDGEDGLPLAVQLIGPPAHEELLLALATQLETALPWAGREARHRLP
jgi:amidase